MSRALTAGRAKWRMASREATQILRLASSWQDRLSLAQFLAKLYLARALPVESYDWDASVRLGGSDYTFGLRTSEIYVLEEVFGYGMYDRLPGFVPGEDWIVFDVGANVGIVSLLQARRGAQVYAFEPNPDCYRRLVKNIEANGMTSRIRPYNLALGAGVGTGTLWVLKGGTTGGTVVSSSTQAGQRGRAIDVTTLDSVTPSGVSKIDLLKIDVEGAEVDVLRGASRVLGITQRVVVEFHSRALLLQVQELLGRDGFVSQLNVEYYPSDAATGQDEVGILYAARPDPRRSASPRAETFQGA